MTVDQFSLNNAGPMLLFSMPMTAEAPVTYDPVW